MRSSKFVSAFTAAERRFVALTRSAEASWGELAESSPAGCVRPPPSVPRSACVLVLIFDSRASRIRARRFSENAVWSSIRRGRVIRQQLQEAWRSPQPKPGLRRSIHRVYRRLVCAVWFRGGGGQGTVSSIL